MTERINTTTAYHEVPTSLRAVLTRDSELRALSNSLTDIQRNEWACYATTGSKQETRRALCE